MAKITVWSKQHENVWKVLQETGRYTVKREYIIRGFLMMTSRSEVMDVMETSGRCEENG